MQSLLMFQVKNKAVLVINILLWLLISGRLTEAFSEPLKHLTWIETTPRFKQALTDAKKKESADIILYPDGSKVLHKISTDVGYYIFDNQHYYGPYKYAEFIGFAPEGSEYAFKVSVKRGYRVLANGVLEPDWTNSLKPQDGFIDLIPSKQQRKRFFELYNTAQILINSAFGAFEIPQLLGLSRARIFESLLNGNLMLHFAWNCANILAEVDCFNNLMFLDGRILGPFSRLKQLQVSRLHSVVAFAFENCKEGQGVCVQVNQSVYGPYEDVKAIRINQQNGKVSWAFKKEGKYYATFDDKVYGPFDQLDDITFGSDGKQFALIFNKPEGKYLKIGDSTFGPFEHLSLPVFGRKGYYFLSHKDCEYQESFDQMWCEKSSVHTSKGEVWGPYEDLYDMTVDQDGTSFAWISKPAITTQVYFNGQFVGSFMMVRKLSLSADGKTLAFLFQRDCGLDPFAPDCSKFYLYAGGRIFGPYFPMDYVWVSNKELKYAFANEKGEALIKSIRLGEQLAMKPLN